MLFRSWGSERPPRQDWTGRVSLVADGETATSTDFAPFPGWPTSAWGKNALARRIVEMPVSPYLSGGEYEVALGLVNGATTTIGRVQVIAIERSFRPSQPQVANDVTFGDVLELRGYDLEQTGDTLALTLHWQARQRMETGFKFFVHLYSLADGSLAAQADWVAHDWTYPTDRWEADEFVTDTVSLSAIPAGRYRLVVGVYDPQSGERLTSDATPPGDSFFLQEVVVP